MPSIFIVDVDGSVGDITALMTLISAQADVRLVTVNGDSGASLAAAVTNIQNVLALMGLASTIAVVPGIADAWPNRKTIDTSYLANCNPTSLALPLDFSSTVNLQFAPSGAGLNVRDMDRLYGMAEYLPSPASTTSDWSPASGTMIDVMTNLLRTTGRPVEYMALGSLTNLADFLRQAPLDARQTLKKAHLLGGALTVGGLSSWLGPVGAAQLKATSEWNLLMDPLAANFVFQYKASPLVRYVYPVDVVGSAQFSDRRWQTMTNDQVVRASPAATAWLLLLWRQFRSTVETQMALLSTKPFYFADNFVLAESLVALAAADPDVRALLDDTPTPATLTVDPQGNLNVGRPSSDPMMQLFLFDSTPSAIEPFWTKLKAFLQIGGASQTAVV